MEVTGGRDGGPGSWSYRRKQQQTRSGSASASATISSSSASGTIVSTAYTSSSCRLSSVSLSAEADVLLGLELDEDKSLVQMERKDVIDLVQPPVTKKPRKETTETKMKQTVQEFFGASSSANRSASSVLERWFTDLRLGWVLHLAAAADGGASASAAGEQLEYTSATLSWIRGLNEIVQTVSSTAPADRRGCVGLLPSVRGEERQQEQEEPAESSSITEDQLQFARFFQESVSRMLCFVDVAANQVLAANHGVPVPHAKLAALLRVHGALCKALPELRFRFHSPLLSAEAEKIQIETASLVSAKEEKAREAIWSTLEEIWAHVMVSMAEDSPGTQAPQASSGGIHKLTRSVMGHITFLLQNFSNVARIVSEAASAGWYVPRFGHLPPFDSMIVEMATCLEEKLVSVSETFPDRGLRSLFLLNNTDLVRESLKYYAVDPFPLQCYEERYLQVSWLPLLSCLLNPTPLCLFGSTSNYAALSKFESEFQRVYAAQKLWKVPDPRLRKKLRKAIAENIIPDYTKYIEDNKVTTPKFTPKALEGMLQDLFEG